MPISTDEANRRSNEIICARLGVDEFYYDFDRQFMEPPALEVEDIHNNLFSPDFTGKQTFQRQFFRFVKDGKRYRFCIDPETKTERWAIPFSSGTETTYDWEAMEKKIEEVVRSNGFHT